MTINDKSKVLVTKNLHKSFGDSHIIRGIDFGLLKNERHAIIGPNGAGKSTFFHLISGLLSPSEGEIILSDTTISGMPPEKINHLGLARSFQITNVFPNLSVFENLRLGVMRRYRLNYNFWTRVSSLKRVNEEVEQILENVRLSHQHDTMAGELSYSEQRSLEIALALTSSPSVLLLDEPMAGMSKEETEYTTDLIKELSSGRSLMIVEHDMDVVFALSDRISVLVYGEIIATGTPEEIRNNPQVQEAYLGEEVKV